jgi:hypothetical protein
MPFGIIAGGSGVRFQGRFEVLTPESACGTPETSLMVKSLNPAWGGVAQSAKP